MNKLAYMLGCQMALQKLGGYRVPVTSEQTPQAVSYKATNASMQERNVESIWDQHDNRQHGFVEPGWNY